MKILEHKRYHIIFQYVDGTVGIEPNTPYFRKKIIDFQGRQIEYKDSYITVKETFTDMIFNITKGESTITSRPNMADQVVSAFGDREAIDRIFEKYASSSFDISILEGMLNMYGDRIKIIDEGFVVDDLFLVARNGQVWNWINNRKYTKTKTNIHTGSICLVVNKLNTIKMKNRFGNEVKLDPLGYEILSKINFLLDPNLDDKGFVRQIPKETYEILKRNRSFPYSFRSDEKV